MVSLCRSDHNLPFPRGSMDLSDALTLFSPHNTLVCLHGLWAKYDSSRCETARLVFRTHTLFSGRNLMADLLHLFPAPLPGFETSEKLLPMLLPYTKLLCSPRCL